MPNRGSPSTTSVVDIGKHGSVSAGASAIALSTADGITVDNTPDNGNKAKRRYPEAAQEL